jgi:Flp pilus assembly protein TadD
VTDALSKLIKFLDQLLPFLETSPAWLRAWVYILIVLNFVTVAGVSIAYLVSKEQRMQDESLDRFSIERPAGNEEIPLGAGRAWMIEGKFPLAADKQDPPQLTVDVLQLPDRMPFPQDGKPRLDTVQGFWRFESARFPGEGSYEIVATVARGSQTLPRMVQVKCLQKAAAYQAIIEKGREQRGAAKLAAAKRAHLPEVKDKLAAMDLQFRKQYLEERDLNGALQTTSGALDLLEPLLPLHPDDFDLQNYRAYFLKDYGMVLRDLNRGAEAESAWQAAGKMFEAVRQQKPDDPSAWNGLGSVAALRGDYQAALQYIDQALRIAPNYEDARNDREQVLRALREHQKTKSR